MKLRLLSLAWLAFGCSTASLGNPNPRSTAQPSIKTEREAALRPGPRLGPFAGAGSGVRRVDVAQR